MWLSAQLGDVTESCARHWAPGMSEEMDSCRPRDGRGQMEPGLHGDLCVAANPGDTAIQRYSSVPGGSLYLHSQHPDAA